jgi:DNA-binding protein HU-beta
MNKGELIDAIAEDSGLSRGREPRRELPDHDGRQDPEEGRGGRDDRFGKFSVSKRAGRTGRNPQTGEPLKIRASKTPRFAAAHSSRSRRPPQVTTADVLFAPAWPVQRRREMIAPRWG